MIEGLTPGPAEIRTAPDAHAAFRHAARKRALRGAPPKGPWRA
ncbi:hypothetical protein T261_5377 [Streptomyces lydicus]|nr:hypothetical protein T261_5377 [Streptomyces lydicus]